MKRLPLLLICCLFISPALAISFNFQDPVDPNTTFGSYSVSSTLSKAWLRGNPGGNNYIYLYDAQSGAPCPACRAVFRNTAPDATTYSAATLISFDAETSSGYAGCAAVLFNSAGAEIGVLNPSTTISNAHLGRWEVRTFGSNAYLYINGVQNDSVSGLSANPAYIGWGHSAVGSNWATSIWDEYVYGQTENKIVLSLPESQDDMTIILDDIINDANDGIAYGSNGTQIDANYLYGRFATGNSTIGNTTPLNETINLVYYSTGTIYAQNYTGNSYSGQIAIDIKAILIDAGAPDGYYALTVPGTGAYSNMILKRSTGATVQFDKEFYSIGDDATITWTAEADYWDTTAYSYKMAVMDVFGQWKGTNQTATTQSGSYTFQWESTNDPGVYYALMIATSKTTGKEYIIGIDVAELSSYAGYGGYVNDAQTGTTISGAFVNITQGGTSGNSTSGFDGNWTSGTVFSTGAVLELNATASGYVPYNYSWTPLAARTVSDLNISLVPASPAFTGLAIGGVDRDFLYGRPIQGATVTVRNISTGEYYTKLTSMTGWYLCDDGSSCMLQTKTPYDIWAYKIGYTNSTTEQEVTT